MFATILSTGSYLPAKNVVNEDLVQFPKLTIPLIAEKTGVRARRHAADTECTSDLAIQAALRCLQQINFDPALLDGIILSTSTPDRPQPPTATRVQSSLGATRAFAVDINAVCSGGLYALHFANSLIKSGSCRYVLIIGAEIYSRYLNPRDFSTYPYFGDGAGAILLGAAEEPGILCSEIGADGSGAELIRVPAGGTMLPWSRLEKPEDQFFKMNGKEVYQFAVTRGTEAAKSVLSQCGLSAAQIKRFISHQANINIVHELANRLEVPREAFFANLDRYGNTASASVMIALDELLKTGEVQRGELILLVAFGGGLAWGASIIRY